MTSKAQETQVLRSESEPIDVHCADVPRCLWFMLEVLMTKNENNSHAFLRKMVENIKQTKDAQCPEDAKANEVQTTFSYCVFWRQGPIS